jgi:hypothetical protein
MSGERTRKPAAQQAAQDLARPAPSPSSSSRQSSARKLDATRAAGLLLRSIATRASAIEDGDTPQLVLTTSEVIAMIREARELGTISKIDWHSVTDELSAAFAAIADLNRSLDGELEPLRPELGSALRSLRALVPEASWKAAGARKGATAKPTSEVERLELARHALAAVREQVARFRAAKPTDDRQQAIALCTPIIGHLGIASDAVTSVADRRQRATLKVDANATSTALDFVAEHLAMAPKLKWDRAFAAAFDAENALRGQLGLLARPRPYSGSVDPSQAIEQVKATAEGAPGASPPAADVELESPQQAVDVIVANVGATFESRRDAIAFANDNLKERETAAPSSISDALLELAASMAISTAAGVIGSLVSAGFRKVLEAYAIHKNPIDATLLKNAPSADRDAIREKLLKQGAFGRGLAGDAAKEAAKELIKGGIKLAKQHDVNTQHPLQAFYQLQHQMLRQEQTAAMERMATFAPALGQADLEVLRAFHAILRQEIVPAAYDRQYDHSMREWQNFKARTHGGARDPHEAQPSRDASIGARPTAGVFDVELDVFASSADPTVSLHALRLTGGEPRALDYFRTQKLALRDLGMNQRYDLRVRGPAYAENVVVGVGPDHGLQAESIELRELRILKLLAEREPFTAINRGRTMHGHYDHIPDRIALTMARDLITKVAHITTAHLKGG